MTDSLQSNASVVPTDVLLDLQHVLATAPSLERLIGWRWAVRQRMSGMRDLLLGEAALPEEECLAPRHGASMRERSALLHRLGALAPEVLESEEVERVRRDSLRLVDDVRRHLQRRSDLAWDDVEQEFGGSE